MTIPTQHWVWRARYDHAHDGDTVTLYVDRGISEFALIPIRLLECYAPELSTGAPGKASLDFTKRWMTNHMAMPPGRDWPFRLQTYKPDPREKYGRWLGKIWAVSDGACLNDDIVTAGFATKTATG